jgi:hypothetical protein
MGPWCGHRGERRRDVQLRAFGAAVLCATGLSVLLSAHHSHGNYDLTMWTVMEGTVKQVVFIVPHSIVYIDVKGEMWALEATNPEKWLLHLRVAAGAKIAQYRLCEAVTKHNNDVVDKTMSIGMRTIEKI